MLDKMDHGGLRDAHERAKCKLQRAREALTRIRFFLARDLIGTSDEEENERLIDAVLSPSVAEYGWSAVPTMSSRFILRAAEAHLLARLPAMLDSVDTTERALRDAEQTPPRVVVQGAERELAPMGRFKFSDSDELQKDSEFGFGTVE
jgi:hypothetical protein